MNFKINCFLGSILGIIILFFYVVNVNGLVLSNPATQYCVDLGYKWQTKSTPEGDIGQCILPDGSMVDEWSLLNGSTGEKWSYCSQKGYKLKVIDDSEKCQKVFSSECVVCVLDDGKEIEATKLMAEESLPGECKGPYCSHLESEINLSKKNPINDGDFLNNAKFLIITIGLSISLIIVITFIFLYIKRRKNKNENL